MINISNSKHLDIVLPTTNKALAQVLTNATTKELETLTQGKDLKSIMGDILKSSGSNTTSNKTLLNLVKSNPTLQNLGNVNATIKDLLKALQSESLKSKIETLDAGTTKIEKVLKEFLADIKDIKNSDLKPKLENSGVFLESKLKDVKNPQVELKSTLETVLKNLQNSKEAPTKLIINQVKELLNTQLLKSTSNATVLKEATMQDTPKAVAKLSSDVNSLITNLKNVIKEADKIHSPLVEKALLKLETQLKQPSNENFKLSSIQEPLTQLSAQMNRSLTIESKSIIGALEKIFSAIKSVEQSVTTPKVSIEQLVSKNIPQDIKKVIEDVKTVIQKADPVVQKETTLLLKKLETLNAPQKLLPQANVKEILTNDLKAILLQTKDEISQHPNRNEITKQIDKLSLQIDNYQLISHLSNASCLYIPFSWDMLKDGEIEFKKAQDNKFFCDINLTLKEYGELNLKLTLYEKNQLNLHIYSDSEEFKEIIKENIPSLRSALIDVQVTPREIRLFQVKKEAPISPYETQSDSLKMGFEVKV